MSNCVMCGSPLPKNQGSETCSLCYGDIDHGTDGYYRQQIEQEERYEQERQHMEEDERREQERQQQENE